MIDIILALFHYVLQALSVGGSSDHQIITYVWYFVIYDISVVVANTFLG